MLDTATSTRSAGLVTVDGRTFPLRSARIEARAQGGLASSTLIQEYANPHAEPLEVLYTMPLPADGAVAGYAFTIGERTVTGTIESREEAQADYRKALMEGRTAGLLEQERADTFTQSIGNVPPGTAVTVRIEVHHPLGFLPPVAGTTPRWEWRFPTVAGVRYEGAAGRVPDAERLDVSRADGEGTPVRITAEVAIDGGRTLTIGPSRLDHDLVLSWEAASDEVEARLVEGRGLPGDDGRYALLTITPPAAPRETLPRDLTILIDCSGSMDGPPLTAAKEVAGALVDSLTEGDQLEILAFSNDVHDLTDGVVRAGSPAARAARGRLAALTAGGATEMVDALLTLIAPLRRDAQRQVVLLTDGYIGFEAEVVSRIAKKLPENSRLHVAGIGTAPNRTLTHAAARAGRGIEVLIGPGDDPREAAERLERATAAPVLTGLAISGSGVEAVAPERPRDVFAGDPARLLVALHPGGGSFEVEARLAGSKVPWTRRFVVPQEPPPSSSVPPLGAFFGRERVEDLELSLACHRFLGPGSFGGAIEEAGLKHRIVTRHTSLVAISENPAVDPRDPRRRERLAVEMPAGVSAEGVGLMDRRGVMGLRRMRGPRLMRSPSRKIWDADAIASPELESEFVSETRYVPPEPADEREGRVVRVDGDVIVLEIDVEEEPFDIPVVERDAVVAWSDGPTETTLFDPTRGTRPGRYAPGTTVRIVLVRGDGGRGSGEPLRVRWVGRQGEPVQVTLT